MNKKKIFLFSILIVMMALTFSSCSAYKEHSTSYSKLTGKWSLNCTYVDASPIDIDKTTYEFSSGKMVVTTTTYTDTTTKDANGNTVTNSVANPPTTTEYTVSASNGKFTAQGLGEIEFNVDTEAKVAHLFYTDAQGHIVHHVLEVYVDTYDAPTTTTTNTTTNTTTTTPNTTTTTPDTTTK